MLKRTTQNRRPRSVIEISHATGNDYPNAARLYTEAIAHNPLDATLFCNRALARMRLEEHGYAIGDCSTCRSFYQVLISICLDPSYGKALYRRALCHLQTLHPQLALQDFKRALTIDPKNVEARRRHTETQKLIRRVEFEKAIEMEEEQDTADRCREIIAEDGCAVEKDYSGPILPSEPWEPSAADQKRPPKERYSITQEFLAALLQWYASGKSLPRRYVWEIVLGAYDAFKKEESMVEVTVEDGETADVIGDVHGQYYDYLHLLTLTGHPSEKHIVLMNGDLVDRGSWSIEVIVAAFAFKWLYPKRMYINRGNHETKDMNRTYGFEGEAKHKHGEMTYKLFSHVFTALPLATMINASRPPLSSSSSRELATPAPTASPIPPILSPEGCKRFFVVHGGLFSRDDVTLEEIRKIPRLGRQPGQEGLMCELLWTDPQEMPGRGPSKRGVGIAFGPDVTRRWCELNKVTGIFRSHEVRQDGYAVEHEGLCTTVFSAPNYVDQSGNKGAFIRVDSSGSLEYIQFDAKPHPPMKPMAYSQGGLAGLFS